jgi:hypothetical protein
MKIYIGPYTNYFGPYQIAEKILFWKDTYDDDDDAIDRLGDWLAKNRKGKDSWLTKFCCWVDSKKKRKVNIRIDYTDIWSMDNTLAMVIVPMLEKLRENVAGGPFVDDEDVPEHLRSTAAPALTEEQKNCGHTDDNWFKRWEWVLDEMIWTFQQHSNDGWEEQYYSGEVDWSLVKDEDSSSSTLVTGPNHTFKSNSEGIKKHRERMSNGRRLFAKYYESLWT